ncbi:MAG: glycoside hydrolase family 5 protein [Lachnospiraceae bacterium]|nr:glycoside hydrolase family 5 protein [Lachnospiraceae bacterium]
MRTLEGYMHGINLGGWLSQCNHTKERYDTFIVEKDIEVIRRWGLDHVRVPVDYNLVEDTDGNYKADGFAYIDRALGWCEKYGLNMVLDLHKTYGFSFDAGEKETGFFESGYFQERFYRLWEKFAERYGMYSNRLAFELLNEVTDREYSDAWNRISTECIRRIRNIAPDIKILLGGYYNNSITALKDLPIPRDPNIVYNFHCYEPIKFTHQGAPWVDWMDHDFRQSIDESEASVSYFENLIGEAVKVSVERGVRLYCGEFGVIDRATPEDAAKWYKFICTVMEKYGIGHAAWSYKEMDFGLADRRMDSVRGEILSVL